MSEERPRLHLLVTGSQGLLGSEVVGVAQLRGHDVMGFGRTEMDVTDASAVRKVVGSWAERATPGVSRWIVHCAAYTAVDRAEEEPEQAMAVNHDGTRNVAVAGRECGARIAYISTDYVFDGEKGSPYLPSDLTEPLSVYGASKLAGEEVVFDVGGEGVANAELGPSSSEDLPLVVRTSWLYGAVGRNFVVSMMDRARSGGALTIVDDQRGRPTWARNVAEGVLDLAERGHGGVWHVADRGDATWLDLAREALWRGGLEAETKGVSTEDWAAVAERPRYSVLDLTVTEAALGRPMMDWRESLRRFLDERE